jgi:hypothetical protein
MAQTNAPVDELSLRELILKGKELLHEVLRLWYIPAICAVLVMAYQAYKYYTYVPVYNATITFSVDEDEGGSASGLTGILGQFGLGSVRPTRYNLDKILALSKSRRVIQQSLFSRMTLDGKEDYLANHLIRVYKLNEPVKESRKESGPFWFTHDSLPAFSRDENEMLMNLYGFIIGPPNNPKKALLGAKYDEDSNIISLDATTTDEMLSLNLAQRMFESLSAYYVNKSIEKQLKTYTIVMAKRDSVLAELKEKEFQLASFKDTHRGLLMRTDQITELRLQREIAALTAMYVEVLKNVEVADFSLKNKTPFIQVIDAPLSPIQPALISLFRKLLIGLVAGAAIGCVFVVGRFLLRGVMQKQTAA